MKSYYDYLLDRAWDEARIRAAELVGENSIEFDALVDRLYESYSEPIHLYSALRAEGHNHKAAMLKAGLTDPDC